MKQTWGEWRGDDGEGKSEEREGIERWWNKE
jgi:hypothetical protein